MVISLDSAFWVHINLPFLYIFFFFSNIKSLSLMLKSLVLIWEATITGLSSSEFIKPAYIWSHVSLQHNLETKLLSRFADVSPAVQNEVTHPKITGLTAIELRLEHFTSGLMDFPLVFCIECIIDKCPHNLGMRQSQQDHRHNISTKYYI